ncbi:MAG: sugar phosphate isomerase/epimerase family protein [Eubacteriales bacterium]|jgi:D-psicose/D-tagatose/L-ribulose 3-epimerase
MKIGFCADISKLDTLVQSGIPCMEMSVGGICAWSDEELAANVKKIHNAGITFESCNSLIGGFSLYDDPDFSKTNAYFDRTLPKLAAAGMKILVFGSGGYRRVPDGMEKAAAKLRILDFLRLLSKRIEPYSMTAVVEPLNYNECNILNTTAEAAEYVRELNLPNIRLLADYYHFLLVGEKLTALWDYRGLLKHTHIAHPVGRKTPAPYDGVDYRGWFDALKKIGYEGMVVAESKVGPDLLADMREYKAAMDMNR